MSDAAVKCHQTKVMGVGCLLPLAWAGFVFFFGRGCAEDILMTAIQQGEKVDGARFAENWMIACAVVLVVLTIAGFCCNAAWVCSRCRGRVNKGACVCQHCRAEFTR